jgi:hypothetical protein
VTPSPLVLTISGAMTAHDDLGDGLYSGHVNFQVTKVTGGYTIKFINGTWNKSDGPSGGIIAIAIGGGSGFPNNTGTLVPGQTSDTMPGGDYLNILWSFNLAGYRTFSNNPARTELPAIFVLGATPTNSIRDVWDYSASYPAAPAACGSITVTDASARYQQAGGVFPLTAGGSISGSVDDPDSRLTETTTERTTITIDGTETCVQTGTGPDVWSQAQGQTVKELSDEDTEDDAVARTDATAEWSPCMRGCVTCPSYRTARGAGQFTLYYRHTQVRGILWAMTIGQSYDVTIKFWSRALGGGGYSKWLYYGKAVVSVTAEATTGVTNWVEVPYETGLEIYADNCHTKKTS